MRRLAPAVAVLAALVFTGACTDDSEADADEISTLAPPQDGVPEGFPSDEVPILDGETQTQGDADDSGSHLVIVRVEGEAEALRDEAIELLTGSGFVVENTTEVEATGPQTNLASADWVVLLTAQDDGTHTTLTYSVAPSP